MSSASDVRLRVDRQALRRRRRRGRHLASRSRPGSFFALLGPSGCGKTTTLRMIGGFEEPDEGAILPRRPRRRRPAAAQAGREHRLPELRALPAPDRSSRTSPSGCAARASTGTQVKGRVDEMLELVGLSGLGGRRPRQLSGGQQQRVALARALVNRPQVLLLDEPLGALDLKLRKQMQLELKGIQHDLGLTFVHVTHDQEEAMTMADAIAVMNRGRIEQLGPPTELYERPATAFVAELPRRLEPAARHGHRRRIASGIEAGDELNVAARRPHRRGRGRRPPGEDPPRPAARGREQRSPARSRRPPTSASRPSTSSRPAPATLVVYAQNTDGRRPLAPGSVRAAQLEPRVHVRRRPPNHRGGGTHESPTDPQAAARARRARRCRADPSRLPGRLRRRRRRAARRRPHRRRRQELADRLRFSNWQLYIDFDEKTKKRPTLDQFTEKTGVAVDYFEDINDNASYFGKIQRPLSQGQSIDRDIIVLTDNSRFPSLLIDEGLGREARQVRDPEHLEPRRTRSRARASTRTASTASRGSPG